MKTNDLKDILNQKVSSTEWTEENTWNVLNQIRNEKTKARPLPAAAKSILAAAAVLVVGVGILAGTGRLGLFGHPDSQHTVPPVDIPLAQGGLVTLPPENTADLKPRETESGLDVAVILTAAPTEAPTEVPTEVPTEAPTEIPTEVPTETPTETPSETSVPLTEEELLTEALKKEMPHSADSLKPIGLTAEDQGLRIQLISGVINGQDAWIVYSLEEPEGKWLNEETKSALYPGIHVSAKSYADIWSGLSLLENYPEHKLVQAWQFRFTRPEDVPSAEDTLRIDFTGVASEVFRNVEIPESLVQEAVPVEGVDLPEHVSQKYFSADAPAKPEKVLDYTRPLDIPLTDNIVLTGIGWIDNLLHVQVHHTGEGMIRTEGAFYPSWSGFISCTAYSSPLATGALTWDDTGDDYADWMEFYWAWSPEDAARIALTGTFSQMDYTFPGKWSFEFPAGTILAEQEAAPAEAPESEAAPAAASAESGLYQHVVQADGTAKITSVDQSVVNAAVPAFVGTRRVTAIGDNAFRNCTKLETVTIPEGITTLGRFVFRNCTKLKSVSLPDSLVSIGEPLFCACWNLESVEISPDHPVFEKVNDALVRKSDRTLLFSTNVNQTACEIPEGVKKIADEAYSNCKMLRVTIPDSVEMIGGCAFNECRSLQEIVIPEGVMEIGSQAFMDCSSLKSVTIPASARIIWDAVFSGCSKLKTINVSPDNPVYEARDLLLINKRTRSIVSASGALLQSFTIPDGIRSIGSVAFQGCSGLREIIIPESVTEIGWDPFNGCDDLVVRAPAGSAAEQYCTDNGITFSALD